MADWKPVDVNRLIRRLRRPEGAVDVVLDTDAYNEIDDQYAIAYLLGKDEKLRVKAMFAAPFYNARATSPADGMRRSYEEILHLLRLMGRDDLAGDVFQGSETYLPDEGTPVASPAAARLCALAQAHTPDDPLYVVAIGAITNVASALLIDPGIRDNVVVVWLGGHAFHWHDNREFNLQQDVAAARVVFGCGAAVVMLPCMGVVSAFTLSEPELEKHLRGKSALCDYLADHTEEVARVEHPSLCWTRPIWDVTAVGWLLDDAFMCDSLEPSPIPEYDHRWAFDRRRHPIKYVYHIRRDPLMQDMLKTLAR